MAQAPTQDFIVKSGLNVLGTSTVTSSTGNTSTLQVDGGAAIAKNLIVGSTATIYGDLEVYGFVPTLTVGTGTFTDLTVTGLSTLNAVTAGVTTASYVNVNSRLTVGGLSQLNNATLSNVTNSVSSTTGALIVDGGVGIQKDLWVGGQAYVNGYQILTTATLIASTLQAVTEQGSSTTVAISVLNTTSSISTSTGALTVAGGVGIAKDVYIGGSLNVVNTSYINSSRILVAGDLETVTFTATYITNDPTSQVGLTAIANTTTVYGTYNFGTVTDVSTINDFNTGTNTGFYSINDAAGAPGYVVYIGFSNVTDFTRLVLNVNYTASSGHTIEIDLYNYVTTNWDTFTTYSGSVNWFQFILGVIDSAPYMSSGNVVAKLYHSSSGNTAHRTWIDYAVLENSVQGGQGPRGATGATGATGAQGLTTSTTSTFIFFNTAASTATTSANAVYIKGGLGIDKSLLVTGEAIFQNNVTFSGTTTYILTTNTVYTDNIIELHYPTTPGNTWTVDDGKDIGIRFHYYDTQDQNGFLGRDDATGYLEWISSGVEDNTSTVSGTFGIFKTGGIVLTNTTASNSTSTGALTVVGGVGVGGTINAGNMYSGGSLVLTTSNVNSYVTAGVSSIVAGTDTAISSSTGAVTIWNNSTLQTVTGRGSTTNVAISITNTTSSTSTTTGALTVTGGVGIQGSVYAGEMYDTGNRVVTNVTPSGSTYIGISNLVSTGTSTSFTITNLGVTSLTGTTYLAVSTSTGNITLTNLGVQTLTAGTDTVVSANTGTVTVWNNSTLQTVTGRGASTNNAVSITNTTGATSTATGALTVVGGVGVGGNLYVGGTLYATISGSITTATNLAGGTQGQVPFQTATGVTSFFGPGTAGNVLVSNGTSAPTYNNTLTLASTSSSTSTTTGALQVRGGVGISNNVYVGGRVGFVNTAGNASVVYQFYNTATNSLDTVFG